MEGSLISIFKNNLRVHVAPVGFEIDRVVLPLIKMRADKVYIISKRGKDYARYCVDQVLQQIKTKLNLNEQYLTEIQVDIYDLVENLRVLYQIFKNESYNHIYINCSTGSKIQSIACMMACMMFSGTPYYIEPEEYCYIDTIKGPMTKGLKNIIILPDYKIEYPEYKLIKCLEIINTYSNGISKKDLIRKLEDLNMLTSTSESIISKYLLLKNNYLTPLINWKFITTTKLGRKTIIKITEDGKNALEIFGS